MQFVTSHHTLFVRTGTCSVVARPRCLRARNKHVRSDTCDEPGAFLFFSFFSPAPFYLIFKLSFVKEKKRGEEKQKPLLPITMLCHLHAACWRHKTGWDSSGGPAWILLLPDQRVSPGPVDEAGRYTTSIHATLRLSVQIPWNQKTSPPRMPGRNPYSSLSTVASLPSPPLPTQKPTPLCTYPGPKRREACEENPDVTFCHSDPKWYFGRPSFLPLVV